MKQRYLILSQKQVTGTRGRAVLLRQEVVHVALKAGICERAAGSARRVVVEALHRELALSTIERLCTSVRSGCKATKTACAL